MEAHIKDSPLQPRPRSMNASDEASREDGRPAPAMILRWRRWYVDQAKEKSAVCSSGPVPGNGPRSRADLVPSGARMSSEA